MYDYVIVGAGSAGCVLAARLTEDPDVSVLLLEAGPPDASQNIHVPLGYLKLSGTELDWNYFSAPEPHCNGRRIPLPRGRVLGGSSSTNAMVYIRGNPRDYDDWRIPGWGWADLLPYFLKAEDNERGASEWHGAGGPLPVSEQRSGNRMSRAWAEAAVQAGIPSNDDFNGSSQDGAGMYQVTQRGGLRASAAAAYLHPAMARPNLHVLTHMLVHRLLFEGTRAVGVEASQLGHVQELRAAREVILCAGAYNSPQLLMLSGVGPAEHLLLRELPVVLDQPAVGENLTDHAATYAVWGTERPESLLLAREPAALEEFMASQTGPLASNLAESGAFVRVEPDAPAPDVQFHAIPVQILEEGTADPEGHGMLVTPCLLTPESRGSVRLASNDPTARPIVRNGFYEHERDLERMVAALRLAMEVAEQPAVAPYCATGMVVPDDDSDAALRAHARRTTFAIYHPVGTCAIGSVVDDQLRVNGLKALRVVDASVMPVVPRGNTNAPTIAIAERAADLLKGVAPLSAATSPSASV